MCVYYTYSYLYNTTYTELILDHILYYEWRAWTYLSEYTHIYTVQKRTHR